MTELIDNPPPLPQKRLELQHPFQDANGEDISGVYFKEADYRAGEAAAFARGVAAGRNAGLEEQALSFEREADKTNEPITKAMLLGMAAAFRKDKQ